MKSVIKFFEESPWARVFLGLSVFAGAVAIVAASDLQLQAAGLAVLVGLSVPTILIAAGRIAGDAGGNSAYGAILAGGAAVAFIFWVWDYVPRLQGWGPWAAPALAACVAINALCLWLGQRQTSTL